MTMGQGEKGVEVAEFITRRRLLRERDAERRRKHAHDGERGPADLHSLSNDCRQPAEATLEQAVRQHDALVVLRGQPAERGPCARHLPIISTDESDAFLTWLATGNQTEVPCAVHSHFFEDLRLLLPHEVIAT